MHRFIRRAHEGNTKERGFFMVWFALTFVALTAFAGLAIEYNRWENIGNRVQKAADAAALAGAVFMPENVGNKAYTTAKTIASQNGFTDGSNGIVITTSAGRLPNQLKVIIKVPTKNPFGGIVGYGQRAVVASDVAMIAGLDLVADPLVSGIHASRFQIDEAALRPLLKRSGQKNFHLSVGCDDRCRVAAF